MKLINWHWIEDQLVRAFELEVRAFAEAHPAESFFATCLEYDGLTGSLALSYGTRDAVEDAFQALRRHEDVYYRAVELRPENWRYRQVPLADPEDAWGRVRPLLAEYSELMQEDLEPETAEFLWLRFEYLADCVIRRLAERGAFRYLERAPEFIAYCANEHESLEEVEDRILKLYPQYRRATVELVDQPRPGELPAVACEAEECSQPLTLSPFRCTCCQSWFCETCREHHGHPELVHRRPFFGA